MSKNRDLLSKKEIEKLISKKGYYYIYIYQGRFKHIISSIMNIYKFEDSTIKDKILEKLKKTCQK